MPNPKFEKHNHLIFLKIFFHKHFFSAGIFWQIVAVERSKKIKNKKHNKILPKKFIYCEFALQNSSKFKKEKKFEEIGKKIDKTIWFTAKIARKGRERDFNKLLKCFRIAGEKLKIEKA